MLEVIETARMQDGSVMALLRSETPGEAQKVKDGVTLMCGARAFRPTKVFAATDTGRRVSVAFEPSTQLAVRMKFRVAGEPMDDEEFAHATKLLAMVGQSMRTVDAAAFLERLLSMPGSSGAGTLARIAAVLMAAQESLPPSDDVDDLAARLRS